MISDPSVASVAGSQRHEERSAGVSQALRYHQSALTAECLFLEPRGDGVGKTCPSTLPHLHLKVGQLRARPLRSALKQNWAKSHRKTKPYVRNPVAATKTVTKRNSTKVNRPNRNAYEMVGMHVNSSARWPAMRRNFKYPSADGCEEHEKQHAMHGLHLFPWRSWPRIGSPKMRRKCTNRRAPQTPQRSHSGQSVTVRNVS